jgi:crotonobetainyl-CoA:carnitine CoA-transferase CaiB-like acyl-CoA transferase
VGFLDGVRVLELGDELGEYCGKVLAGLGADVIKVEPPGGEVTRGYGPFFRERRDAEASLHFWHYNFGKRGVVLDLEQESDRERFGALASTAQVLLETRAPGYFEAFGLGYAALAEANPGLIWSRISPFGDDGPWASYKSSDLVQLALGGVAMNCGYDPDLNGRYDTPPVSPQPWQAYQIAGEMAVIAILGALLNRQETGLGQRLSTAIHGAVSQNTELDVWNWVYQRQPHRRQTARHSRMEEDATVIAQTKDGRWLLPYLTYLDERVGLGFTRTVELLDKFGAAMDLHDERYADMADRQRPEVALHIRAVINRLVSRFLYERDLWRDAQDLGLTWAPIRKPEENVGDAHWQSRETFIDVPDPDLGETFAQVGAKWYCAQVPWRRGPRAPHLGEHNAELLDAAPAAPPAPAPAPAKRPNSTAVINGVRMLDLSWLLASGGAGRFLAAMGAEVIRIEHLSRPDPMRWASGLVPPGGKAERAAATGPIKVERPESPNRSGYFMDINAGKRAISLNLKDARGRELLTRLIPTANVIAEGFSPGTMTRMGFGYERLRELNPGIIYAQQSGMGEHGSYGRMRSYGPVAQAFSGLTEQSGLPDPYPPAGIGYSYLDWFGAYNLAVAILAALNRQRATGEGCWIDASQVEAGTYLTGPAVLDHSANGQHYTRSGNRSPHKPAAPHGIYRVAGEDRWIAISCFEEEQWRGLVLVLGSPAWAAQPGFATLAERIRRQDDLDAAVESATRGCDAFELMHALQAAGVPAGVCATAEDRVERDPQLAHLDWLHELPQSEIGTWPSKQLATRFSGTPASIGGPLGRHGPSYGEDNEYVFGEILGLRSKEIADLAADGVI